MSRPAVVVNARGATRWRYGHPWIFRSDVEPARIPPGIVRVEDRRGRFLGQALWSPRSEIRLRLLATAPADIGLDWWTDQIRRADRRRSAFHVGGGAYRVVHGEGDGLPSLIVDRYGDHVVAQLLSAGLESVRDHVAAAIRSALDPQSILLRNDVSVRRHEGLPLEIVQAYGVSPEMVEILEGPVRYRAALRTGQKTGAFLDQRENRELMGRLAHGRGLDLFSYQGLFALHLARQAASVMAVDSSGPALEIARQNAELNGLSNIQWREANVFDLLRALEEGGERFDTIVLDPPAFAKRKDAVERALAGYKEINLRAMRILSPGGVLFTASCSFHVGRGEFFGMLADAAADSGRRLVLERIVGQGTDHPELLTVPETGYLKGAILRASD
ncbi:MAG: class I SAM-dependent rRNA methyltransferase [Gemmatimonadetes bacterium]|nr:class I SAM-dependent rRNA methyltransferase [Gemmatimonadota bacterium]